MKKILLVEDDQFLGPLLKARLEKDGLAIVWVKNADEAFMALKKERPDLILLDIILPDKSGFEALAAVKADPQMVGAPIVILSNLGQEEDIAKGKQLGASDYLIKADYPSIDDLVVKIREFLK